MLRGQTAVAATLMMAAFASGAAPQTAARSGPGRPPLFFSESWKSLPTPPDDHNAWPASQEGVASPNLELMLYGPSAREIQLVSSRGEAYPHNLWTGTTTSPSAAALRDRRRYVDLSSPLAKIRWVVRTSGFHQAWPIVRLADGTWLVGDRSSGPQADFNQIDVSIADLRWLRLDIARVVTVGTWIERPDLTRVDAVGFADLLPGSGHGPGGYVNVARIEVYGAPVGR